MLKILLEDVSMRTSSVRDTQLAEQLVEVPTIVPYSSVQRTMEQHVDIPVPGRGGRISGLQGFPPGQCPTALHVSQERISERIVEQFVDFTVSGGGLQDFFAQDRVHPLLRTFQQVSLKLWMSLVKVFFALFPKFKKCEVGSTLES